MLPNLNDPAAARGSADRPRRVGGGRTGLVVAALAGALLVAASVYGDDPGRASTVEPPRTVADTPVDTVHPRTVRGTEPIGDLRCLTRREEDCLEEPVPADEPHGADCATCHDLWSQASVEDAVTSCASSGCHEDPSTLTPFHATVEDAVLEDCVGCHDEHDSRIPGGADNCAYCHASGGAEAEMAANRWLRARATWSSPDRRFEHERHAEAAECTSCHASGVGHGVVFRTTRIDDCRSCHHTQTVTQDCQDCHVHDAARSGQRTVVRTLDIVLGGLDRPSRRLPFDHTLHADETCLECHEGSLGRSAEEADCSGCHEEHHQPSVDCTQCHEKPVASAHDADAHLGCGGSGCHENAEESVIYAPRTRQLCLVCHQDRIDHNPAETCADCHQLPTPSGVRVVPGTHE